MKKVVEFKKILFGLILILVLIPVILLTISSGVINRNNANKNYKENADLLLKIAGGTIDNKIGEYYSIIQLLSSDGDFYDFDKLKKSMDLLEKRDESILNIYYASESDGSYVQSLDHELPEGYNAKSRPWFINSMADQSNFIVESPYSDPTTGNIVLTISKAVTKDNSAIGVVSMDIELTKLADILSEYKYGETGQLMICTDEGVVISNTDESKIGGQEPLEYDVWNNIISNDSGEVDFEYSSNEYLGYYSTTKTTGWKIILKTETNEIRASERYQLMLSMLIMLIILVLISIIINIGTKMVSNNIKKLVESITKASKGDLKEKIKLNTIIKEFKLLEESFNNMSGNLTSLLGSVNDSVINVDNTAVNSIALSEEISESIGQVTSTMTEISEGTGKSADALENIASDMEKLSSSINEIKNETNNVNKVALETNKLGGRGLEIAKLVLNKSNETKNSTEEVNSVVNEVSSSIEKIENINSSITAITEQTNLLALNAAIEAARAGEAGKGFAVVADEIRKLAEETAVSAHEIDSIIKEISEKSNKAVDKVSNTTNVVKEQEEAVMESQKIFKDIVHSVESLSDKVSIIADSISVINTMKDNVLDKVGDLSALLEETAAGSEEVTASAHEVNASTETFVHDLNILKEKTEELKQHISTFNF
ncbi:methyl-accepting chemotaxis protein [Clostridium butyricum]